MGSHVQGGEVGNGAASTEVVQSSPAENGTRALTQKLMESICEPSNLNQAYRKVKSNNDLMIISLPAAVIEETP
jgi:RNA-directed DNA polymerase